jgi:hypothetical protein
MNSMVVQMKMFECIMYYEGCVQTEERHNDTTKGGAFSCGLSEYTCISIVPITMVPNRFQSKSASHVYRYEATSTVVQNRTTGRLDYNYWCSLSTVSISLISNIIASWRLSQLL